VSANYTRLIDRLRNVFMHVELTTDRRNVIDYAIVLLVQIAEIFHRGTLGEGMRAALHAAESGHEAMIESWEAQ
jgi:hypothetical protein